jgi:hypothetical protein
MTIPDALLLCPGYARVRMRLAEYNALMSATGATEDVGDQGEEAFRWLDCSMAGTRLTTAGRWGIFQFVRVVTDHGS